MDDLKLQEEFIARRAKGESYDTIVKEMRKSKPTLIKWGKKFETVIKNRRAMQIEELMRSYEILKENRIEILGKRFKKIQEALNKKDFVDLDIEILLSQEAKLLKQIRDEDVTVEENLSEEMESEAENETKKDEKNEPLISV